MKLLLLGPVLYGAWLIYKSLRDVDAWRSVRLVWFVMGLGLFAGGIGLWVLSVVQHVVETPVTTENHRSGEALSRKGNEPAPVFQHFGRTPSATGPSDWK